HSRSQACDGIALVGDESTASQRRADLPAEHLRENPLSSRRTVAVDESPVEVDWVLGGEDDLVTQSALCFRRRVAKESHVPERFADGCVYSSCCNGHLTARGPHEVENQEPFRTQSRPKESHDLKGQQVLGSGATGERVVDDD